MCRLPNPREQNPCVCAQACKLQTHHSTARISTPRWQHQLRGCRLGCQAPFVARVPAYPRSVTRLLPAHRTNWRGRWRRRGGSRWTWRTRAARPCLSPLTLTPRVQRLQSEGRVERLPVCLWSDLAAHASRQSAVNVAPLPIVRRCPNEPPGGSCRSRSMRRWTSA